MVIGDTRKIYFLTGSTGFLGRALVAALRKGNPGSIIRCLIRKPEAAFLDEDMQWVVGDMSNEEALRVGVDGADVVLHFAGATRSYDPVVYHEVNYQGTARLVAAAEQAGVKRFIFASSRAVGTACGAYGESKFLAEQAVTASRLPYVILRFSEVYGGQTTEGIGTLVRVVQQSPWVPVFPGVNMTPLYLEDALEAVLASVRAPAVERRIYTIAGPRTYTFTEGAKVIASVYGVRRIYIPIPISLLWIAVFLGKLLGRRRIVPDQIDRMRCRKETDIQKAVQDLGFSPRSFEEGLQALASCRRAPSRDRVPQLV